MSGSSKIELEVTGVRFYSRGDEAALFDWLNKLPCIETIRGQGPTLYLSIDAALTDEDGMRELLALFHRFRIEKRQLAQFDREEFASWFRNPKAYWYQEVFG